MAKKGRGRTKKKETNTLGLAMTAEEQALVEAKRRNEAAADPEQPPADRQADHSPPPPPADFVPSVPPVPATSDLGKPTCPVHYCEMYISNTKDTKRYWRCHVEDCPETEKTEKHERGRGVPKLPTRCPLVDCGGSFCVVDTKSSSQLFVVLVCPACGYKVDLPRPEAIEALTARQPAKRDILDV